VYRQQEGYRLIGATYLHFLDFLVELVHDVAYALLLLLLQLHNTLRELLEPCLGAPRHK